MPHIGRPLAAAAISPWILPLETSLPGYTRRKNYSTEYVAESFHQWGSKTYLPPTGLNDSNTAYVTLLGHPFSTYIPILVTFGESEALGGDIVDWAEEMRAIRTNQVELYCDIAGIHAALFVGEAMGWEQSARDISSKVGEFTSTCRTTSTL